MLPPVQRLPPVGRLRLWRQRLVARRPGSLHWLVEPPTPAQSALGAQQSPLSAAALGALPKSGLPRTGLGLSPSCRRLVLPLWLPTRPTGNLRPATPFYRHRLSRRQLALRRADQRPWQTRETPSNHPATEGHLPVSFAPRFQRDTHALSPSVFTEYLPKIIFSAANPRSRVSARSFRSAVFSQSRY